MNNTSLYSRSRRPRRKGVRILVKETGEIYNSISECADALGVNISWLGKVSRRDQGLCTCRGLHLIRIDEDQEEFEDRRGRPTVKVRIVETGEVFNSISECAEYIGGSPGAICDVLYSNRGRLTHKGYSFELV